jgi:hypothetical protein
MAPCRSRDELSYGFFPVIRLLDVDDGEVMVAVYHTPASVGHCRRVSYQVDFHITNIANLAIFEID